MNKRLMFSAAFVMALLSANAQKRAFTIEDLYRVKGVSSVSLSPLIASVLLSTTGLQRSLPS